MARRAIPSSTLESNDTGVPPGGGRWSRRTDALLDAAYELLCDVGYDRLTIDAVAAKAGSSKTTIYRRWVDKRALVIAVMTRQEAAQPDLESDTGTLHGDLLALMSLHAAIAASEDPSAFVSLLYASQHDSVIADLMRDQLVSRRRNECRDVLTRALRRGEISTTNLDEEAEILLELMLGQVIAHKLLRGLPIDAEYVRRVVEEVLIPVLGAVPDRQS